MDISMPGIGGLEAIGRIIAKEPRRGYSCSLRTRTRCMRAACWGRRARLPDQAQRRRRAGQAPSARWPGQDFHRAAIAQQLAVQQLRRREEPRRDAEREGVQGLPRTRQGQIGERDRRGDVVEPAHHRHASLQHQAEARRLELGRARTHRDPRWPDRGVKVPVANSYWNRCVKRIATSRRRRHVVWYIRRCKTALGPSAFESHDVLGRSGRRVIRWTCYPQVRLATRHWPSGTAV